MEQKRIDIMHCAHLDLFWMGCQDTCLRWGARIIDDAVRYGLEDPAFHFMIETVRFVEFYLHTYPDRKGDLKKLVERGQIELGADYVDKLEASHDGESLARNLHYGKRILRDLLDADTVLSYHPDLPGTTEQTPQVFAKCGIRYYLGARGFKLGARFLWRGLDGTSVIMYNFPIHYSYYNVEADVIDHLADVRREIGSDDVAMNFSSGDLGDADSFLKRISGGGHERVRLREYIRELNGKYPELHFALANTKSALDAMETSTLIERDGENTSRWGHNASALHVEMLMLDKRVSATLMDAEKFSTIATLLGAPVAVPTYERHLLAHPGNSGGKRKYFELRRTPDTVTACIDDGWLYQLITQDHNYGGVEGAQTEFDRFAYKNAALTMAKDILTSALSNISALCNVPEKSVLVFNPMNWTRGEMVAFADPSLDSSKAYFAEDEAGNAIDVKRDGDVWRFFADGVPSVGYKRFSLREGMAAPKASVSAEVSQAEITLQSADYIVIINRRTGCLTSIHDRALDRELIGTDRFLEVSVYEDLSCSVNDTVVDKPLLDASTRHVREVVLIRAEPEEAIVRVITEVMDCKLTIDITLSARKKEVRISPTLYWCAISDLQMKMNLSFSETLAGKLVYGVPYGAQTYGRQMEDGVIFKTDEISDILYARYREVEKWFAMEGSSQGVSVASNHSAYDFDGHTVMSTMMRNVRNIGDNGVQFTNKGIHRYHYAITSYAGTWEDAKAYRTGWALQQPMHALVTEPHHGMLPGGSQSFLDTGENGILTVLKPSQHQPDVFALRVFNPASSALPLPLINTLGLTVDSVSDMLENPVSGNMSKLSGYEIKTALLSKTPKDP